MLKIFTRRFFFSLTPKHYQKHLNDHIKKTLQAVSTPGKLHCRQTCQTYFYQLSISKQSELNIKARINMIFSAAFQLENFEQQQKTICDMILEKKIQSQSELDRVVKFVFKEMKWNSLIGRKQIEAFLEELENKNKQFQAKVEEDFRDKKSQFIDKNLNNMCKKYRQVFSEIDSKLIYEKVNLFVQSNKLNAEVQGRSANGQNFQTLAMEQNKFWDKIHNIKPRLIKQELNTPQIFQQHKLITNGRLRFRFPPQPNGYLHIGHIKSIRMNFETAKRLNGQCFLRYDDTNPEKETPEFIEEIQRNVKWMGYTPDKINFTSDYFEQMLHFANQLVKQGKAYVCESSQDQIQAERKEKRQNAYRSTQKSFSQKVFPHLNPNQTLRLKLDPTSPNPTLRDPIIYRYKHHPHPKTGSKYTIYPMYDFAHCISDSLEHIDYSLCSLEFQIRRQLYYKILEMLGLYKPIVWQFSRLNVKGNVISKRKIKELIEDKKIEGWDDPRLLTIKGMERRGYTPKMLNEFIDKVNASRSGNEKYVRIEVLEKEMKKELSKNSQKIVAIKNPIKVRVVDGNRSKLRSQQEKLAKTDFVHVQKQQLQRAVQGREVILKQAGVYRVNKSQSGYSLELSGKSVEQVKREGEKVPILSWLCEEISQKKVVYFGDLLDEKEEFNKNSRVQSGVWVDKEAEKQVDQSEQGKVFYLERIGYFKRDSKTGELICCTPT